MLHWTNKSYSLRLYKHFFANAYLFHLNELKNLTGGTVDLYGSLYFMNKTLMNIKRLHSFHADLQSDAFRDDTPTLPPSSAPALNWLNLWELRTSDDRVRKHPGNNYDKTRQPGVWK